MNFLPSQANYRKLRQALGKRKNYCGPGFFSSPFASDGENKSCQKHDHYYGSIQKKAKWHTPYWMASNADDEFLYDLDKLPSLTPTGWAAKAFFATKRKLLPRYKGEGDSSWKESFPSNEPQKKQRIIFKAKHASDKKYVRRVKKSFAKRLYGLNMAKRYRRASKRYRNKRGRFNYRKRFNRTVAKVVRGVSLKQSEFVASAQYTNYFPVANGVVGTPTTPASHRSVTWSYPTFGDSNRTISALSSTVGYTNNSLQRYRVIKHVTQNRITNAGLHPVHLTVYKYYFPSFQLTESGLTGTSATAAAEIALYNTAMSHSNCTTNVSREIPLGLLWSHNLYKGIPISATISDAQRSWYDTSSFKTGTAAASETLVSFSRPVGCTKFKFKEMNDQMLVKKYAVVTLNPGESYNCKLIIKNKWITADEVYATNSGQFKGATGFFFHAVGGLVHDATDPTDIGRGPVALDMEVQQYWKIGKSYGNAQATQANVANRILYADIAAPQHAGPDYAEEAI